MNFLIVANKAEKALYAEIIKSAPNATVLGAVSAVDKKFFDSIKEKWSPHAIIYDTDVPIKIKNTSHYETVINLRQLYPYLKIIVLTGKDDVKDYAADAVIRGSISNVEFINTIKNLKNSDNSEDNSENSETDKLTASSIEYKKIYAQNHLKNELKKTPPIKTNRSVSNNKFKKIKLLYIILPIALVFIITGVVFSAYSNINGYESSTADETITTVEEIVDSTQIEETKIEAATDSVEGEIEEVEVSVIQETAANNDSDVLTENDTPSSESKVKSSSSSTSSKSDSSQNSKSNDNKTTLDESESAESKTANDNTAATIIQSGGGTPSVSYNNKNYSNSANGSVSSIKLSYSSKTLRVNDTLTLTAEITPAYAKSSNISWSSTNSNVVSVTSTGKMTAKKTGTATIIAKIGDVAAQCKVTVISY